VLQRIDIDVVAGKDFCYPSYDTALVLHGDAQIPVYRSGVSLISRSYESRNREIFLALT
jgi:hypothetical protein